MARIRAYLSTCCSPSAIHGPNFVRLRGSSWATLWPRALILWIKFATLRVSRISACRSVLVDGNSEFGTLLSGSASSTCATHEKIPLQLEIWAQQSSNGCSLGLPMALLLKAQLRKAHDLPLWDAICRKYVAFGVKEREELENTGQQCQDFQSG